MPRLTADAASQQSAYAQKVRWIYLVHNPQFQKDMGRLNGILRSKRRHNPDFEVACRELANKWGLLRIPKEAIWYWPTSQSKPLDLNAQWMAEALEALESYGGMDLLAFSPVTPTELREKRFLFVRIDLKQPVETLLPLIEAEVRRLAKRRPQRRLRSFKEIKHHVRIFDLAQSGRTFPEIGSLVRRRVSSVKGAYLTAARNVLGSRRKRRRSKQERLKLALAHFDPKGHAELCPTCKAADRMEKMCQQARQYAKG